MIRIIAVALALCSASCQALQEAQEYHEQRAGLRASQINQLEKGMTLTEVRVLLGPYSSYSSVGDGTSLYQWISTGRTSRDDAGVHVALIFQGGKMKEIQHLYVPRY